MKLLGFAVLTPTYGPGAKMCARGYGAGCLPGSLFLLHGAGNIGEGLVSGVEIFDGKKRDWNVGKMAHSWWTKKVFGKDMGREVFIGADAIMSGAALKKDRSSLLQSEDTIHHGNGQAISGGTRGSWTVVLE